jgi:hypothetical protein
MIDTTEKILTNELRYRLKDVIQKELNKLSEQLEALDPKERLNVLCKLMPYVFPKVDAVHLREGEPFTFD